MNNLLYKPEEQEELLKLYSEEPTIEIRNKLIENNLRLVTFVISRYFKNFPRVEYDDLFQNGVFGLIAAIDKYDSNRGKFSNIAIYYIRNSIRNGLFQLTDDLSLEASINGEEDGITLGEVITDESKEPFEDGVQRKLLFNEFIEIVRKKLKNDMQYKVISLIYGLDNNEPHTIERIADIYNINQAKVILIRNKALRTLRMNSAVKQLAKEVDMYTIYYKSPIYTHSRSQNKDTSSPVERAVLERERMLERLMKEISTRENLLKRGMKASENRR